MDKQEPTPLAYLAAYRDAIEPPPGAQEAMWATLAATANPKPSRAKFWGPIVGLSLAAAAACFWFFGQGLISQVPPFKEQAQQAPYSHQEKQPPELLPGQGSSQTPSSGVQEVAPPPSTPEQGPEAASPLVRTSKQATPRPAQAIPANRPPSQPIEAPEVAGSIAGELRLLQRAEALLHQQQYTKALQVLEQHIQEYGSTGQLVPEVTASKVTALCRLGREQQASSLQRLFVRRWPNSPLRPRVDSACAETEKSP